METACLHESVMSEDDYEAWLEDMTESMGKGDGKDKLSAEERETGYRKLPFRGRKRIRFGTDNAVEDNEQ